MINMLVTAMEELDEEHTVKIVKRCLAAGLTHDQIWRGLNEGLTKVGDRYEKGDYTITDLMVAGIIFEHIVEMMPEAAMSCEDMPALGRKIILGTVEGDMHDIGKSIFKGAVSAAGFTVIDLGIDVKAEAFYNAALEHEAAIVGISAILTESIPYVKETVDIFTEKRLREKVKIILGGCIANKTVSDFVGADAYTRNALKGVEICKSWI